MTTRLEHHDGKKRKFWQISVDGYTRTIVAGNIGAKKEPAPKEKTFKSADAAQENLKKEVAKKITAGFFDPTSLESIVADHLENPVSDEDIEAYKEALPYLTDECLAIYRTGVFHVWTPQFETASERFPGSFYDLAYLSAPDTYHDDLHELDPFMYVVGQLGDGALLVVMNQGKLKDRIALAEHGLDDLVDSIDADDVDGTIDAWLEEEWLEITDQDISTFVLERALHHKGAAFERLTARREAIAAVESNIAGDPSSIEELVLEDLNLQTLPDVLSICVNLKSLSVRKNQLKKVPEVIRALTNLEHLDLYYNQITIVPEWLAELPLKSLNLGINRYQTFPEAVAKIETLESLYLDAVDAVPAVVENLTNLTSLYFSRVSGAIDPALGRCSKLRELHLGEVTTINPNIGELSNLETLTAIVRDRKIDLTFPDNLGNLSKLRELSIGQATLPDTLGGLKSLTKLVCCSNTLPDSLCEVTTLEHLNLRYCRASALPESFGNLVNLEWLNLEASYIENLPKSFSNLKSLKFLNLMTSGRLVGKIGFPTFDDELRAQFPDLELKGG